MKDDITKQYTDISAIWWLAMLLYDCFTVIDVHLTVCRRLVVNIYIYSIVKQQSAALTDDIVLLHQVIVRRISCSYGDLS